MRAIRWRVRTLMLLVALAAVATPVGQMWALHAAALDERAKSDHEVQAERLRQAAQALHDAASSEAWVVRGVFWPQEEPRLLAYCSMVSGPMHRPGPRYPLFEDSLNAREEAIGRMREALSVAEDAAERRDRHRGFGYRLRTFFRPE